MSRLKALTSMDLEDIARPPVYDVLVIVSGILGGLYASIMPRATAVRLAVDVSSIPLIIAIIYLAVRGAAGVASLIANGVFQLYLSYPISRRAIATILVLTRILVPSIIIVGAPMLIASIMQFNVVSRDIARFLAVFSGRIIYLYFIGIVFLLIALASKRAMLAGALSIVFFFAYIFINGILNMLYFLLGNEVFLRIAQSLSFSDTLNNYLIGLNIPYWTLIPLPVASIVLTILLYMYVEKRFEPT